MTSYNEKSTAPTRRLCKAEKVANQPETDTVTSEPKNTQFHLSRSDVYAHLTIGFRETPFLFFLI